MIPLSATTDGQSLKQYQQFKACSDDITKQWFLNQDDIIGIHIECSACQVKSSYPLSKLSRIRYQCPHCNADWMLPHTNEETVTTAFLSNLKGMAEALKGRGFTLNLEVKCPDIKEGI